MSRTNAGRPTVLVTGAAGFTGRYLIAALDAVGYAAIGMVQSNELSAHPKCVVANLLDCSAINRLVSLHNPRFVIHLAAVSFVAHDDVEEIYRTNVVGTRNLLDAISRNRTTERVILASSGNIYGQPRKMPVDEAHPLIAANDYAVSKIAMEQLANLFASDVDITIVRPFNYTGLGQSPRFLVPKIVDAFRNRQPVLELGNLDVWRDFTDVRDVVAAYVDLLRCKSQGPVNLCSGSEMSLRQVIETCANLTSHQPEILVNSKFVRANDVRRLLGDNSKLRSLLPRWSARPFSETLAWMLSGTS